MEIWVNVREDTHAFLGAYTSMERALDASIGNLDTSMEDEDGDSIISFPYHLDMPMTSGTLTVEDILNGEAKSKE
jgi:hypothetical protein